MKQLLRFLIVALILAVIAPLVFAAELRVQWINFTDLSIECPSGQVYYDNGHGETFMGNCGENIVLSATSGSLSQKPVVGAKVLVKDTATGNTILTETVPWHTLYFPYSSKAS